VLKSLEIKRFKSIRSLKLECRKVNLFIGPPDTGKSNILESLYFLSRLGWGWNLDTSLRLTQGSSGTATFGGTAHFPELKFLRYFSYTLSSEWQYSLPWPDSDKTVLPPHGYNLMYIARPNVSVILAFECYEEPQDLHHRP